MMTPTMEMDIIYIKNKLAIQLINMELSHEKNTRSHHHSRDIYRYRSS
jgi:hypothetical protein